MEAVRGDCVEKKNKYSMYATDFWEGKKNKKKTFVILLCTAILFTEATHAFGPRLDMKQHLVGISA